MTVVCVNCSDCMQPSAASVTSTSYPRWSVFILDWLIHSVWFPIQHRIGHFGDVSLGQSLGLVLKKLNLTQQRYAFTNQKKCTRTRNKRKKLKPSIVAFYDIWPGNGAGLFLMEKDKWGSIWYKQANNIYCAKIKNRIKGALYPGARTGLGTRYFFGWILNYCIQDAFTF